jgi:uncharacterized protein
MGNNINAMRDIYNGYSKPIVQVKSKSLKEQINELKPSIKPVAKELLLLLGENNVCDSHNIHHALAVYNHCSNALKVHCSYFKPDTPIYLALRSLHPDQLEKRNVPILLAALLHDADDHKFFPSSQNNENARKLLRSFDNNTIELVIKMIKFVSCSENGDTVPEDAKEQSWLLYPRYADRLEAIGKIGAIRCLQYSKTVGNPLFTKDTVRVVTEEEVNLIALERYRSYKGKSVSMIDHYYDKLIKLGDFETSNEYFKKEAASRKQYLINIVIEFGKIGQVDELVILS